MCVCVLNVVSQDIWTPAVLIKGSGRRVEKQAGAPFHVHAAPAAAAPAAFAPVQL